MQTDGQAIPNVYRNYPKEWVNAIMRELKEMRPEWTRSTRRFKARMLLRQMSDEKTSATMTTQEWAAHFIVKAGWRAVFRVIGAKLTRKA